MSRRKPPRRPEPCAMSTLLHVTREDGVVTKVGRDLVISGPMTIHMNGQFVGTTREYRR